MYNLSLTEISNRNLVDDLASAVSDRVGCPVLVADRHGDRYSSTHLSVVFTIPLNGRPNIQTAVCAFQLTSFEGNDAIVISHGQFVWDEWRRLGIGTLMTNCKMEIAKAAGCKLLLATVDARNEAEMKIMTRLGWTTMTQIPNDYGCLVNLMSYAITGG